MSNELVRFSVAMPEDLLIAFDELVARRGIARNRSEVIRDLVRDALIEEEWNNPYHEVVGTLTMVYNHHEGEVGQKLDDLQHQYYQQIISTMHVHLDAHNCLEVIALRGSSGDVRAIADALLGLKGVKHGQLSTTTTGQWV